MPNREIEEIEEVIVALDPIKDIINKPPSWLTRWGQSLLLFVVVLVLVATYYIRYPDYLVGDFKVTSNNNDYCLGTLMIDEELYTKVNVGQEVKVSLVSFDINKYGSINGIVSDPPEVKEDKLSLEIKMDKSQPFFQSGQNNLIEGMNGIGKLKVSEKRLIHKFLNSVK